MVFNQALNDFAGERGVVDGAVVVDVRRKSAFVFRSDDG